MTSRLGLGIYPGISANEGPAYVQAISPGVVLCAVSSIKGPHAVARALRQSHPGVQLVLRVIPDWAALDDSLQYADSDVPQAVLDRWFDPIMTEFERYPGLYDAVVGINERWPSADNKAALRLRAAIEWAFFNEFRSRGIQYLWGSIPTGNLEAEDVPLFANLFREAITCYHAYMKPGCTSATEDDAWHSYRPFMVWQKALDPLGIKMRGLFCGELGTFEPFGQLGLSAGQAVRISRDLNNQLSVWAQQVEIPYYGGCAYGIGLEGKQREQWELSDARVELGEHRGAPLPTRFPPVVVEPPPTPVPVPPNPPIPPGGNVSEAEFERLCADIWFRAGVSYNPFSAFAKYWKAELQKGRYLGRPEGPEHKTEFGQYVIQEFASAILSAQIGVWTVKEGLP